jgi:hypothetical protein
MEKSAGHGAARCVRRYPCHHRLLVAFPAEERSRVDMERGDCGFDCSIHLLCLSGLGIECRIVSSVFSIRWTTDAARLREIGSSLLERFEQDDGPALPCDFGEA